MKVWEENQSLDSYLPEDYYDLNSTPNEAKYQFSHLVTVPSSAMLWWGAGAVILCHPRGCYSLPSWGVLLRTSPPAKDGTPCQGPHLSPRTEWQTGVKTLPCPKLCGRQKGKAWLCLEGKCALWCELFKLSGAADSWQVGVTKTDARFSLPCYRKKKHMKAPEPFINFNCRAWNNLDSPRNWYDSLEEIAHFHVSRCPRFLLPSASGTNLDYVIWLGDRETVCLIA